MTRIDPTKSATLIMVDHDTRVKRACKGESLNVEEHGVVHSTSVLETNCLLLNGTLLDCSQLGQKTFGNASQYM